MFRRSKAASSPDTSAPTPRVRADGAAGKGRPTPSRREAEAAARARAKAAKNPKGATKQQRQFRAERSREIRQGIKEGDERYLPTRDRGPVRRFVRDFVDSRLCMAEFALPLLFASLLLSTSGLTAPGNLILNMILLMVLLDSILLRWRMRRELKRRFPDESLKGTTFYAYMRSLQMRFMRLPKAQVKLGQRLPQHY